MNDEIMSRAGTPASDWTPLNIIGTNSATRTSTLAQDTRYTSTSSSGDFDIGDFMSRVRFEIREEVNAQAVAAAVAQMRLELNSRLDSLQNRLESAANRLHNPSQRVNNFHFGPDHIESQLAHTIENEEPSSTTRENSTSESSRTLANISIGPALTRIAHLEACMKQVQEQCDLNLNEHQDSKPRNAEEYPLQATEQQQVLGVQHLPPFLHALKIHRLGGGHLWYKAMDFIWDLRNDFDHRHIIVWILTKFWSCQFPNRLIPAYLLQVARAGDLSRVVEFVRHMRYT